MSRTIRGLVVVAALVSLLDLLPLEARGEKRIGVLSFSEQARYDECISGIKDQLGKEGFAEPAVSYVVENARGSKAKAMEVAQRFAAAKMDLIVTIGTSATLAATRVTKDLPIVFSQVYDPVEAGIARGWRSSGNNTTGASSRIPVAKIVEILGELVPVKRLAVIYTPGEKNSEAQLLELQKLQGDSRLKVIPVILYKKEEAARTVAEVMPTADAIYLTGSSIVGSSVAAIVDAANRGKVATVTHLDDLVEKGALLGVGVNAYLVGRLAGKKAARVLKGAKPSAIPIEPEKKLDIMLNMRTANAGQFQIPPSFRNKVTRVIQ